MVILDEEAANERSPLKSPNTPLPPPPHGAPPPTYAASTSTAAPPAGYVQGYHAAQAHHESPAMLIRRDTPGQRFLKAFLCALFVLFLWSLFLDTLSMVSGHRHRYGGYFRKYPSSERLQEIVTSPPCPCATPDPIRVLPIQYPPSGLPSAQSVPTSAVPCATAIPK
jgi:hypothetical protein